MSNPEKKCEKCGGVGYTAEHSSGCYDHDGEGNCLGNCPVQVPCDCKPAPFEPSVEPTEEKKLIIELITNNQAQQKILREQIESLDRLLVITTNRHLRNERNRHG